MGSKKIKVVIADDHPIFRSGLVSVFNQQADIEIVGEAANGQEALSLIESSNADVAILDVDMPEMDGIETARQLKDRSSSVAVVFLTMHRDAAILRSMQALNAKGYVLKDSALHDIVDCVRRVSMGKKFIGRGLDELVLDAVGTGSRQMHPQLSRLTKTELQIVRLVGEYKTSKEISQELFVSVKTIETHRYNICLKLGITGPHALLAYAVENQKYLENLAG
ncbi:MAG TPA: DNA-binding response regulator [Blastocatellia bacterium]|nr:DNA-binding response regulator [Blastocatellia bacterium]